MGILHRGEKMSCGIRIVSAAFAVIDCMRVLRLNLNRTNHGNQRSSASKRSLVFPNKTHLNNIFNQTVSNPWNSWWLFFLWFPHLLFFASNNGCNQQQSPWTGTCQTRSGSQCSYSGAEPVFSTIKTLAENTIVWSFSPGRVKGTPNLYHLISSYIYI